MKFMDGVSFQFLIQLFILFLIVVEIKNNKLWLSILDLGLNFMNPVICSQPVIPSTLDIDPARLTEFNAKRL